KIKHVEKDKDNQAPGSNSVTEKESELTDQGDSRSQPVTGTPEGEVMTSLPDSLPGLGVQQEVLPDLLKNASDKSTTDDNPPSPSPGGRGVDNSEGKENGSKDSEPPVAGAVEHEKDAGENGLTLTGSGADSQPPVTTVAKKGNKAIAGDGSKNNAEAAAVQYDAGTESNSNTTDLSHPSTKDAAPLSTTPDPEFASDNTDN
ncbi:mucin-associated surface protein (MASP), putative, partial [Trypanosoma cruzi marinkellei]